jgi:hydrogenase maturation protease
VNGTRQDGGGPKGPPLFIGVGNDFRSDDGVGPYIARELAARVGGAARCVEASGEGTRLIELWSGSPEVVLFDAVSAGAASGEVLRIDAVATPIPGEWFRFSSHSFGVAEAVEMARVIGRLPASLTIYGIQGECFESGTGLSAAVRAKADDLVREIANEVVASRSDVGRQ